MIRFYSKNCFLWAIIAVCSIANAATIQNFDSAPGQTPYTLSQYQNAPGPALVNNTLLMVNTGGQRNVIAFDQTDSGLYNRITAEWDLNLVPGADGLGFALLNTAQHGTTGAGPIIEEEPSLAGAFAVGFDIYCPDDDNYQKKGSHEISLHWDGVERANKWSPFDYRTGTFNRVRVIVNFVAGGAEITVNVGSQTIYDKYFLAGLTPYDCRAAFGARTGGLMTTLYIDNVNVQYEEPTSPAEPPVSVRTYDRRLMNGHYRDVSQIFSFPSDDNTTYERVVMTLTVEEPSGGWDGWDRMMGIYIWDEAQQNRYEIARFMTPYSKAGKWYFDVTDYQNLLRGNHKMDMWLDSWIYDPADAGYWITTDFDFYEGQPEYRVVGVQKLWSGTPTYGAGDDPQMTGFFADRQINIPAGTAKAKLRFMVTGHGQGPNTDAGAEFIARGRTVTVNNASYYNMLWKDDCYLNPCRPQSGTWKYSRAGWAPGDKVTPWEIDITGDIVAGQTSAIDYQADEYINSTPDWGNVSRQWVEAQIIFYEPWTREPVAHWQFNDGGDTTADDASGNAHDGTLTNMDISSWTLGKQCTGLAFDGIDDYVEVPGFKGITGGNSRTCTAWIKTSTTSGEILTWGQEYNGGRWIIRVNEGGQLRAEVQGGNIIGSTLINDGIWHHIAVVLENDNSPAIEEAKLYVDGQLEIISASVTEPINTGFAENVLIGTYFAASNPRWFSGLIDEVRIYGRAVNAGEIQDMYQQYALISDVEPDGDVDLNDFTAFANNWENSTGCEGDLTCDCIVDMDDLMFFIDEWLNQI